MERKSQQLNQLEKFALASQLVWSSAKLQFNNLAWWQGAKTELTFCAILMSKCENQPTLSSSPSQITIRQKLKELGVCK